MSECLLRKASALEYISFSNPFYIEHKLCKCIISCRFCFITMINSSDGQESGTIDSGVVGSDLIPARVRGVTRVS